MPPILKWALSLALLLSASLSAAASGHGSAGSPLQPLYDVVAVGRGPGQILLATVAAPAASLNWRIRTIPLPSPQAAVRSIALSAGGTKALVVFADGTRQVLDLTERIAALNPTPSTAPQHRLPDQRFPFASSGRVCLLNDLGDTVSNTCEDAADTVIAGDGQILYALGDGRLLIQSADGNREQLPYRLPPNTSFELLAGHPGDAHDFLVLTTRVRTPPGSGATEPITTITDPEHPDSPLGEFDDPLIARLAAQIIFSGGATEHGSANAPTPADLTTLAVHLKQQAPSPQFEWSFFRVTPNPELYAPVLELASGEPDFPSDVNIWQQIAPLTHDPSRAAYQAAYASLGDGRWSQCAYYVRTLSFPGTWLFEYWFYYPFDEGSPHPHLHDSEHFFVEVDKLGGAVRTVFASDHDSFVPNDTYSTLLKNARPIPLPLFATVELGKHAMAPDLDRDGRFTRGVDDNVHPEPYAVWGLRDRGGELRFLMEPYRTSMTLPRQRDDRLASKNAAGFFPGIDVPTARQACTLEPLPDDPPCANCLAASATAAIAHLVDNPDARVPENIYKPYVLPWREFRAGVGIYDWREGRGQLSLGMVGDLRHMTGGLLPLPARLAIESDWSLRNLRVPLVVNGQTQYTGSSSTLWAGARIERLVTHTQGVYFGVTPEWSDISARVSGGALVPAGLHWQYTGVSYHAGYLIELPSWHKGNLTNHIGVVFRNTPNSPLLFEWRVSFGFLRQRGRHDFGARPADRNPYQ